jgi:hypothetical protein
MNTLRALVLIGSLLAADGVAKAQNTNCGNEPCVAVVSNSGERCGSYDLPPAFDLVNRAPKHAVVTVRIVAGGRAREAKYEVGPNGKYFLGCSGKSTFGQRVSYNIVSVVWH